MATLISSLVSDARIELIETSESFWTDLELVAHCNRGIKDLKRAIDDNYQDYFLTVDRTNVSLAANSSSLTGIPSDVTIIRGIEPRVQSDFPGIIFRPKPYNHPLFQAARSVPAQDPSFGLEIYYAVTDAGAPVGTPTIRIAPQVTSAIPLQLMYVPSLAAKTASDVNPIPGESDNALIAWIIAYALARENEEKTPDAGWLAIYKSEKDNLLGSLAPRQTDEEEVVDAMFESEW